MERIPHRRTEQDIAEAREVLLDYGYDIIDAGVVAGLQQVTIETPYPLCQRSTLSVWLMVELAIAVQDDTARANNIDKLMRERSSVFGAGKHMGTVDRG